MIGTVKNATTTPLLASAVICEPVRTPIGRYGGMFKCLTAVEFGVACVGGGQGLAAVFERVAR